MLTRRKAKLSLDASVEISPASNASKKQKKDTSSPGKVRKIRTTSKKTIEQGKKIVVEKNQTKSDRQLDKEISSRSFQNSQPSSSSQNPNSTKSPEVIACYKSIEYILAMKYADVHERLKLTFPAKCTQSLKECSQEHARNQHMPKSDNNVKYVTFLKSHHLNMFNHMIQMDVLEAKFPGRSAIQTLLELILCVNESTSGEYEVKKVIEMSAITINSIFTKFPPCWLAANREYREILQTKEKKLITDSIELLNTRTLFDDLMNSIGNAIQAPAKRPAPVENKFIDSTFNDSLFNDSLDLQSFSSWELKNAQKYSFDSLPRDEKIDRIFLALGLIVQLFETDLAMWTIRNIRNPSAKIFNNQKGPLIGSVLWSNNEPQQVNFCIKNILKLYVDYISIDFPFEHIRILGRLVNLIFNVFDLKEFPSNKSNDDDHIEYPQSTDKQSYFCDAFTKTIFESDACNIELWLKIIQTVEHPRLKLYLINALLTKIEHKKITLNPRTIYTSLGELEKQYDDINDKTHSQNNNVVRMKNSTLNGGGQTMKYPHLQRVSRRSASELSYEQNAELHLVALRAYMAVFHTVEFQQYWTHYDRNEAERLNVLKRYETELKSTKHKIIEPSDLHAMNMSLDDRIEALGRNSYIYGLDLLNEHAGLRFTPCVDTKRYRNDAKFVDMIATNFPRLRSKLGNLFPKSSSML